MDDNIDPKQLREKHEEELRQLIEFSYSTMVDDIDGFQDVLGAGVRSYPAKLGFAFQKWKNNEGQQRSTAYKTACERFGREEVTRKVLDLMSECCLDIESVQSLFLSLSTDETIVLDGLYLFLTNCPCAVLSLLQSGQNTATNHTTKSENKKREN